MIFTTSYVGPDMDGTSCAIAYAEYLNKTSIDAEAILMGEPTVESLFVLKEFGVNRPRGLDQFEQNEKVILLDASEARFFIGRLAPEQIIEVIDHRKVNEAEKFTNAKIQIEMVGAAATLVAERFRDANVVPSETSARLLQAAIVSNTQNFQSKTTTERDHIAMKWLGDIAPLPEEFIHRMFEAKSDFSGDKLANAIDAEAGCNEFGGKKISCVQLEMVGSESLVNERLGEIGDILSRVKSDNGYDYVYLSLLDIEQKINRFICFDPKLHNLLSEALGVLWSGDIAIRNGIIMRKEIAPLMKVVMEAS